MGVRQYTSAPLQLLCEITQYEVNWGFGFNVLLDAHLRMRVELGGTSVLHYARTIESSIQERMGRPGDTTAFNKTSRIYRELLQRALNDLFTDFNFQTALAKASGTIRETVTYLGMKEPEPINEADYNNDNKVTLGELIPYLSEQVRRETRNAQSPTVAGKFDPALSIGK